MEKETTRIPQLLFKYITESISDEERTELFEWAERRNSNKKLLERLSDSTYLEQEIRKRKAVNPQRPLADMKARIVRTGRSRRRLTSITTGIAAAALLLVGLFLFRHSLQPEMPGEVSAPHALVTHGTTQALLTFEDGTEVCLGADSAANANAIAMNATAATTSTDERHEIAEPKIMDLSTPRGGEFKVTLEDGTEVWLNAQTRLRYPDTFEDGVRRVQLEGEAYFKVAKNTEKPFIVESGGQTVRVTGTEFNINAYQENGQVYTTLVEGGIALKPQEGNGSELMLTPGHQAVFNKIDEHASVRKVDTGMVTSWRTGSFVFENQTLEQIMVTLSRWYDFDYEFMHPELKEIIFMGSVPRYGEFNDVLRILETSGNIRFRLDGKHLILSRTKQH